MPTRTKVANHTKRRQKLPQKIGLQLSKFAAPVTNRFVSEANAVLGQQLLHIPEAQAKPEIEPDGMANDNCWKTVTVVMVRRFAHLASTSRDEHLMVVS